MEYFSQNLDSFFVGDRENKLTKNYHDNLKTLENELAGIQKRIETPLLRPINIALEEVGDISKDADFIVNNYSKLIVFGTGGSSLGGESLCVLGKKFPVSFCDNIDPDTFYELLANCDLKTTCFLIISKSGSTLETIAQALALVKIMKSKGLESLISKNLIAITENKDSLLRKFADEFKLKTLIHDNDIGGRYALFSNVSLLPAAVSGVDIEQVRNGGRSVIANSSDPEFSAKHGAAAVISAFECGYHSTVMMPYANRLKYFTTWHRQLWAESIGKNGKGSTPLRALGTVDQHSQLQLYLDGCKDKIFNLFEVKNFKNNIELEDINSITSSALYLKNKSLDNLMSASLSGTGKALKDRGCPTRLFSINKITEIEFGALAMHFIFETILSAALLRVNPFDQPAVEEGKIAARSILLKTEPK